jgi:hypothetical protein|tara:strand:+ start:127 stop:855 length:729 start_codon:yes stop_codon:yes gene_type:complete
MASSFSTNSKLELITTGEKAGLWGTITNTNLQILEQLSTGYLTTAQLASGDLTLALDNGATSTGKNLYIKLTGTLGANRNVTIPSGAERVMIFEDATTRGASSTFYTITVKTVSGSGVVLPIGSTSLVYSDGTNVNLGLKNKGYVTLTASAITAYTAVDGDQILANTTANPITVTLPASPSTGSEVTFVDDRGTFANNNLIVNRNSQPILGQAANLTVSTNGAAFTLLYVNSTRGWVYKDNI